MDATLILSLVKQIHKGKVVYFHNSYPISWQRTIALVEGEIEVNIFNEIQGFTELFCLTSFKALSQFYNIYNFKITTKCMQVLIERNSQSFNGSNRHEFFLLTPITLVLLAY